MTAPYARTPAIACITWARAFPGTADQAGCARCFLGSILGDSPVTADAVACLSELAANAVQHSRSGGPGGRFTVRVRRAPGWLRVEVTDEGGRWAPGPAGDGHGRGLVIVAALAASVEVSDTGPAAARTVAFEMTAG